MKRLLIAILIIAVLFASVWEVLALLYAGHGEGAVARAIAVAVLVLGSLAAFIWLRPFWRALAAWGVGFLAILVWFNTLQPSNDRDWQPDVAKVAWAEVSGDKLTFHNVRDFDYRSETDFTPRYEDRVYDLSKLRGLDLVMSYWGSPAIAHTIMSWDFEGSRPLAISIETRKSKGQEYSAVKGFFRHYEIIYVAADERDVVRVRTNYRGEDDYLYRLKVVAGAGAGAAHGLRRDHERAGQDAGVLQRARRQLHDQHSPARHARRPRPRRPSTGGCSPTATAIRCSTSAAAIDTRLPFAELRAKSHINAKAKALDRTRPFRRASAKGLPDPRSA